MKSKFIRYENKLNFIIPIIIKNFINNLLKIYKKLLKKLFYIVLFL